MGLTLDRWRVPGRHSGGVRISFAVVFTVLLSVAPASAVRAQPAAESAEDREYRNLIEDAVEHSRDGRLEEALALFRRAHRLRPSARTYRGIGLVRFGMRDYAGTISALRSSLSDERRPLEGDTRAEAEDLLARARRLVARVRLTATPTDARITVDGRPPILDHDGALLANPGRHEVRVERDGFRGEGRTLSVEGGSEQAMVVNLRAERALAAGEAVLPAVDSAAPEVVPLSVRSRARGLTLHATPMREGEPDVTAVSELCTAPCDTSVAAGLYRLAIGRTGERQHPVGDYRLESPLDATLHYRNRSIERVIGWIVGGVALGVAFLHLIPIFVVDDNTARGVLSASAIGFVGVGVGFVLGLGLWGDYAAIDLTPAGAAP